MNYNFKAIEKKWNDVWAKGDHFKAVDFHKTKPKFYALYEFFNVSGKLHMGHLKGSIPTDVLARYKRLAGFNVLFPIGGDAFGLPAENAAIKNASSPKRFVEESFKQMLDECKKFGLSFDYSRTFSTTDADYYKWTQWIFTKLLEHGKAYKQSGTVNYCKFCETVLSNEDSQGGKCDRCGNDVEQQERQVWFLKMKEYSEKLLKNIEHIEMTESLKEAQRNWIGKSEGALVDFEVESELKNETNKKATSAKKTNVKTFNQKLTVFTTRIDTIMGVGFLAISPEHELIENVKIKNIAEVKKYCDAAKNKTPLERKASKEKTGVLLDGVFAISPGNGKRVPIFVADYVLPGYGTGAVMGVPCHDERDFEFATKFNEKSKTKIEMRPVIKPTSSNIVNINEHGEHYQLPYCEKDGVLINSTILDGLGVKEAQKKMLEVLEKNKKAKKQINYAMADWPFNRQRFWGEPFPVVFCDHCGTVALDVKDLPLTLPEVKDFRKLLSSQNGGKAPLATIDEFVNCKCPKCNRPAKRETDTMPNWAGSSWYWLRYCDPHNNNSLADFDKLKYWGEVDCYTGGTEHITRHVLYSFFWQNFLFEIGAVPSPNPFKKKMGSGLVLDDTGKKMSKSSTNGVSPVEVVDKFGCDATRMHLHFLGGYEDNTAWTYKGMEGITNFLERVWALPEKIITDESKNKVAINQLIKKVGEDYNELKLNTATAAFMTFLNTIKKNGGLTKQELKTFLILLNPLAPYITSEVFENNFGTNILDEVWPKFDEKFLQDDTINLPVQINGKMKGTIQIARDLEQKEVEKLAAEKFNIDLKGVKKVVYVSGRIVNFIV